MLEVIVYELNGQISVILQELSLEEALRFMFGKSWEDNDMEIIF